MATLEEIFDEQQRMAEREDRVRDLENQITADMSTREYRRFRELRHLLISGPEAGPGEFTYSDCRIARECAERGEYPVTLAEYRAEVELQRERTEDGDENSIADYRRQRQE
jgi:hypothetical protein